MLDGSHNSTLNFVLCPKAHKLTLSSEYTFSFHCKYKLKEIAVDVLYFSSLPLQQTRGTTGCGR